MKAIIKTLVLLFIPLFSFSQKESNWSITEMPLELAIGANEVIRLSDQHFEVKSLKEGRYYHKEVVTILNEESDANVLVVYYDLDSKIKNLEARIYDAKGTLIRKVAKDEIKDYPAVDGYSLYQDDRLQFIEINQASYPYTIVWEYEKTMEGIDFILYPDWMIQGFNQGIETSSYTLTVPKEIQPQFEWHNMELDGSKTDEGKSIVYHWEVENLKPVKKEAYGPPSIEILPMLLISPSDFLVENISGSMSSWKDFGQFIYSLFEGKDQLPDEVTAEIRERIAGISDTKEKVEILYRFLQEKMRYVSVQLGIGGWQPFDANYVAKNSYGDCKALTNYMMALLKKAGITSHPVLIKNGSLNYQITKDFTNPSFNHVILYVPEIDYWLECTSNNYPANYIGKGNMARTALMITKEGGVLKRTPAVEPQAHKENIKASIQINSNGTANISYQSELTGSRHEFFRYAASNYSPKEKEEWLQENSALTKMNINKLEINCQKDRAEAQFNYSVQVMKYGSAAGKRMFIPLNQISVYGEAPSKLDNRLYPVYHRRAYSEVLDIEIELPQGFSVEALPFPEETLESEFASYKLQIKEENGKVYLHREVEFRPHILPASDYDKFRKFYRDISRREKAKLVLVEKKT